MSGPPQLSGKIKIPKRRDLPSDVQFFSGGEVIDFLLLTVKDCEFLSCIFYLQEPLKYYAEGLGYVYVGEMGGEDKIKKLKVGLIQCDMGGGVGGSAVAVKNAVTTLRPKGVFCVGVCGGMNKKKAKLGDVVVSKRLIFYSFVNVTKDGVENRGPIVPLSKKLNDIVRHAGDGWRPPLKNIEEAGEVVSGMMLSGPELVNDVTRRDELLKQYPRAIAIEMEGEGVYTAAHDLKMEWAVIKGISDYADGTKADTKDWQQFASLMAASVVAHILSNPMVFDNWPHYEGAPGGTSTVTDLPRKRLRSSSGSDSGNKGASAQPSAGHSKRARIEPSSSSDSNQTYKVKEGPVSDDDRETLAKKIPCHWEALGRRLKIDEAVLKGFQRNFQQYPEYSEKASAMLKKWQERDGEDATYQVLYHALLHEFVERKDLAQKICCWKLA